MQRVLAIGGGLWDPRIRICRDECTLMPMSGRPGGLGCVDGAPDGVE